MTATGEWKPATVRRVEQAAEAILLIDLQPTVPEPAKPGSHVDVRVSIGGSLLTRSYSIVDAAPSGDRITLGVFRTPQSRGGSIAMHALRVGDILEITAPQQNFPLRFGAPHYVLLAGGIGITALRGMANALRRIGANYTLVFSGRSRSSMAFLDELESEHPDRLQVHVNDEGTSLDIRDLIATMRPESELYMCGPIRLMDATRRAWIEAGLPLPNLRFETFGNSGWQQPQSFTVSIPRLGITTTVPPDVSMLDALEAAGADMMFDCRKGECGLCEVRVLHLDGAIDHRDVFYSERQKDARGKICCCVSRIFSDPSAPERPGSVEIEVS
jgi:ferredoxin-NADP reductase